MKQQFGFYLFTAAAMLLLPAATLLQSPTAMADTESPPIETSTEDPSALAYHVLDVSTGEILIVPVRDYLIGAVCAEMPATFEPEALKAQTVAAHTYAERIRMRNQQSPDAALLGADFSNDSSRYQAYYTEAQLRQAYGDAYETCYTKVAAAVDAVVTELLYYDGEPIIAAFHAISAGMTESAENIWGEPLAYLTSVESPGDLSAPQYQETVQLSEEAVKAAILRISPETILPADDPAAWCTILSCSTAGTVLTAQCGNSVLNGQALREAFGLRSACFTLTYAEGMFTFTTKGYGHAVGMSQYGANAMAKSGSNYQEILAHYYPNTTIVQASS